MAHDSRVDLTRAPLDDIEYWNSQAHPFDWAYGGTGLAVDVRMSHTLTHAALQERSLFDDAALAFGAIVLLTGSGSVALAAAGFALGHPLSAAGLVLAAVGAVLITGNELRTRSARAALATFLGVATFVALSAGAGVVAHRFWDVSWDGQAYHQPAIRFLKDGWNPFAGGVSATRSVQSVWIDGYPRAVEVLAASVARLTGDVEDGKALACVLAAAAGALAFVALRRFVEGHPIACAAVAALRAANPVALSQFLGYYVDGHLASLLLAAAAAGALHVADGDRLSFAVLSGALLLAVNVKFTGAVYATLAAGGVTAACWWRHGWRTGSLTGAALAAVLIVSGAGVGFDPYVRNLREHGHLFHPLAGAKRVDVMGGMMPDAFLRMSRAEKLVLSISAESSGDSSAMPRFKPPWIVRGEELAWFRRPDVRTGGFGPLFALSCVLASVAYAATARLRVGRVALAIAGLVLATVFVNPEAWWARYAPQLWFVPVLALVPLLSRATLPQRLIGFALAALLATNAVLVLVEATRGAREGTREMKSQLAALRSAAAPVGLVTGPMETSREHLRRFGISWVEVARDTCADPTPLTHTQSLICRLP